MSGSKMSMRLLSPTQRYLTYVENISIQSPSPALARSSTALALSLLASPSICLARAQSGFFFINALPMRMIAVALAYFSQQPRWPQLQGSPSTTTIMCPISPPTPCAPLSTLPLKTMPPPTPVPRVTSMLLGTPREAPKTLSASAATLASLSTNTGRPSPSHSRSISGTFRQSRLLHSATSPVRGSCCPGMPTPTAAMSAIAWPLS